MSAPTVREVMTRTVRAVRDGAGYEEMVDALVTAGAGALPVVDGAGRVLGVVSDGDLLAVVARGGDVSVPASWGVPVTIDADTSVAAAARVMDATRMERLPVVGDDGQLIGIVSRRQLLRAALPPDPARRDELAGPVLRRVLARRAPHVHVETAGGVVTLTGTTDRRSTAQLVLGLARSVPGVVDVVDRLTYAADDTVTRPRPGPVPSWFAANGTPAMRSRRPAEGPGVDGTFDRDAIWGGVTRWRYDTRRRW
jgi:CBS domain-containing protein